MIQKILIFSIDFAILPVITLGIPQILNNLVGPWDIAVYERPPPPYTSGLQYCPGLSWCRNNVTGEREERKDGYCKKPAAKDQRIICCCGEDRGLTDTCCWDNCDLRNLNTEDYGNCTTNGIPNGIDIGKDRIGIWKPKSDNPSSLYHLVEGKMQGVMS